MTVCISLVKPTQTEVILVILLQPGFNRADRLSLGFSHPPILYPCA